MDESVSVVTTGIELIALAVAMGAAAAALWILPVSSGDHVRDLTIRLRLRLWRMLGLGLLVFTPASVLELLLRAASMSELPLGEAYSQLGTVLFKTHYGDLWLWRMAALLILWIGWAVQRRRLENRAVGAFAFAALAAISFTLSAAGHAGDDGLFTLVNAANTLHIIGALLWGGGILATALIILPALLQNEYSYARELTADTSLRLSTLAAAALAMVLIPGVYNAWLLIGSWQGLVTTPYGQILVAKVSLVGLMMVLGALNRYRYVPAAQEYGGRPLPRTLFPLPRFIRTGGTLAAVRHFLRSLRVEMALALAVLVLASALSQQTPAIHAQHETMPEHHHHEDSPEE